VDSVSHFEIPVDDKGKAKEFYASVFGWQLTDIPMQAGDVTYTLATTTASDQQTGRPTEPGAINGAIIERSAQISAPVVTITVASVSDALQKVTAAGGKVAVDRQEIPGMGAYGYFVDVAGNVIGLWETV
jgi:predicted enzyme related to lactoylglutathione lyase